jgi:hypothetical protein
MDSPTFYFYTCFNDFPLIATDPNYYKKLIFDLKLILINQEACYYTKAWVRGYTKPAEQLILCRFFGNFLAEQKRTGYYFIITILLRMR